MSDVDDSPTGDDSGTANGRREENGVLVNLPRARPQRASARRSAARNGTARNGARPKSAAKAPAARGAKRQAAKAPPAAERASKPGKKASVKAVRESAASSTARASRAERSSARETQPPRQVARRRSRAGAVGEAAPRQGYESESDRSNDSVQPPGGIELVTSAAELVGELAKAGVSTGERMLKDVLSRLPL